MKNSASLGIALGIFAVVASPAHALTWIAYTDSIGPKEYAVTDLAYTWHDAHAYALSVGADLVAINDAAENAWLVTTFPSELFWTGGTDQAAESVWVWTNGDPWSYTNWNPGEPNDATEEEWLHINWGGPGGWNDFESGADYVNAAQGNISYQNDSSPARAILERRALLIPESGTWIGCLGILGGAGVLGCRRILRS
ncbi:MAG: C-type lectin domain-containing protein [Limisphaerales bacterium]